MVYVLNKYGKPLMPTTRYGRVRRLLRKDHAVVVDYRPFTIQLTYDTPNGVQAVKVWNKVVGNAEIRYLGASHLDIEALYKIKYY